MKAIGENASSAGASTSERATDVSPIPLAFFASFPRAEYKNKRDCSQSLFIIQKKMHSSPNSNHFFTNTIATALIMQLRVSPPRPTPEQAYEGIMENVFLLFPAVVSFFDVKLIVCDKSTHTDSNNKDAEHMLVEQSFPTCKPRIQDGR